MASAQALGQGEGIRGDAQLFITPEATTPPHAHLNFIKDQQDVSLRADLAQA